VFLTGAGSVPETSTWVMLLLGFAGVSFVGYQQTKKRRSRLAA
jgi:hypothetical protein